MVATTSRFSLEDFIRFKDSALKNLPDSLSQAKRNEIAYRIGKTIGGKMGARFLNDAPPFEEFRRRMRLLFDFLPPELLNEGEVAFSAEGIDRFSLSMTIRSLEAGKEGEEATLFQSDAGLLSGFLQYYLGKEKMIRAVRHREAGDENYRLEIVAP